MRPGQQNNSNNKNRQRGRNNGGRKHMNPLSRNYESNGPDVKVRGNAAHIAEKYVQLARDAHASGDSVMAENYLQHAEHYFRIVSAAQPQRTDSFGQPIEAEESEDDFIGDEQADRFEIPQFHQQNHNNDRPFDNRNRNGGQQGQPGGMGDRQPRFEQPRNGAAEPRFEPQPARVEASAETGESPEVQAASDAALEAGLPQEEESNAEPRRRERRPRRRRPQMVMEGDGEPVDPDGPQPDVGELPAFITAGGANNPAE
jgi:hypothetical protein